MQATTLTIRKARTLRMLTIDKEFDEREFEDLLRRTADFLKGRPLSADDDEGTEAHDSLQTEEGDSDN